MYYIEKIKEDSIKQKELKTDAKSLEKSMPGNNI